MLMWINEKIDRLLQPEALRPEHLQIIPSGEYVPVPSDMVLPSIAAALAFVFIRQIFDRLVVYPVGHYYGLKDRPSRDKVYDNPVLEKEYIKSRNPSSDILMGLSKKTGLTEKHVQMWFRKRKKFDKVSVLQKLSDSAWTFLFCASMSWYGIYVLWDKQWVTSTVECWKNWPNMTVSNDIYWYYVLELAYYMSYTFMLFTEHKRKDFLEYLIHHNITVILLMMSWSVNAVRIGTLVLCLHDPADYVLALAKSSIYIKKQWLADIFFVIFVLLWVVTRLIIYPYIVLYSCYVELPALAEHSSYVLTLDRMYVIQLLKALLLVLQVLHIIWTIHIIKSAATKVTKGKLQDARSDSEDDDDNNEDTNLEDKEFDRIFHNHIENHNLS